MEAAAALDTMQVMKLIDDSRYARASSSSKASWQRHQDGPDNVHVEGSVDVQVHVEVDVDVKVDAN